jgi:ankyrin repeat protein
VTDIVPAGGKYGTALRIAFEKEDLDIIELLLEQGADPNERGASLTVPGRGCMTNTGSAVGEYGTVLQAAAFKGWAKMVALLLEKGVDPNIQRGCFVIPRMCD